MVEVVVVMEVPAVVLEVVLVVVWCAMAAVSQQMSC